ncbi:MAG: alanine racemase [Clostridia bacterium]|nr:alanine racemase [Clostridia bacterium]
MQKTISVINLNAIKNNALKVRKLCKGRKLYAVVKADAYGHGAEIVSAYIEDIVDGFCVAIVDEGASLRIAGISKPILVFTPPLDEEDVLRAKSYKLTVTVNSVKTAQLIKDLPCHVKVNTGMNRLGCNVNELPEILSALPPDSVKGVYSHFYAPHDITARDKQFDVFSTAVGLVKKINPKATAHISASGGILAGDKYLLDGARAGILLYGYTPYDCGQKFQPALKVYARRTQVTPFIGGGVGYNTAEEKYDKLCAYRCGYADGFFRTVPLGEKTLCMDAFLKKDGGEYECVMDNAEEYAKRCGTISYEVLTNATHRSEKFYVR